MVLAPVNENLLLCIVEELLVFVAIAVVANTLNTVAKGTILNLIDGDGLTHGPDRAVLQGLNCAAQTRFSVLREH
jgi:hypothetical protein